MWRNCHWETPRKSADGFCEPVCPSRFVRLGIEDPPAWLDCRGGSYAYCCEPSFRSEARDRDERVAGYKAALKNVLLAGNCKWDLKTVVAARRRDLGDRGDHGRANPTSLARSLAKRGVSPYDCLTAFAGTFAMLWTNDQPVWLSYSTAWDETAEEVGLGDVKASRIAAMPSNVAHGNHNPTIETIVAQVALSIAASMKGNPGTPGTTLTCKDWQRSTPPTEWFYDPDDGGLEIVHEFYLRKDKRSLLAEAESEPDEAKIEQARGKRIDARAPGLGAPRLFLVHFLDEPILDIESA